MSHRPLTSTRFDLWADAAERAGLGARRSHLLAQAEGAVLDLGAGDGYNLALYPAGVSHVTVLEPELLARRRLQAEVSGNPSLAERIDIRPAGIEEFEAADGSFDTVISTFALCMVADLDEAVARIRRWLTSSGRLLFLEHVRAPGRRGVLQRLGTPAWQLMVPGCHLDRDVNRALWNAGMVIGSADRFVLPLANPIIGTAVEGVARRRLAPPAPSRQHDRAGAEEDA